MIDQNMTYCESCKGFWLLCDSDTFSVFPLILIAPERQDAFDVSTARLACDFMNLSQGVEATIQ